MNPDNPVQKPNLKLKSIFTYLFLLVFILLITLFAYSFVKSPDLFENLIKKINPNTIVNTKVPETSESTQTVFSKIEDQVGCSIYDLSEETVDSGIVKDKDNVAVVIETKEFPELYIIRTDTLKVIFVKKECTIGTQTDVDMFEIGQKVSVIKRSIKPVLGSVFFKNEVVSNVYVRPEANVILYVY